MPNTKFSQCYLTTVINLYKTDKTSIWLSERKRPEEKDQKKKEEIEREKDSKPLCTVTEEILEENATRKGENEMGLGETREKNLGLGFINSYFSLWLGSGVIFQQHGMITMIKLILNKD